MTGFNARMHRWASATSNYYFHALSKCGKSAKLVERRVLINALESRAAAPTSMGQHMNEICTPHYY
jgi:hypothetical protein